MNDWPIRTTSPVAGKMSCFRNKAKHKWFCVRIICLDETYGVGVAIVKVTDTSIWVKANKPSVRFRANF